MSKEITKDMIGCLCWFWDIRNKPFIGILGEVNNKEHKYFDKTTNTVWKHCRPALRSEIEQFMPED